MTPCAIILPEGSDILSQETLFIKLSLADPFLESTRSESKQRKSDGVGIYQVSEMFAIESIDVPGEEPIWNVTFKDGTTINTRDNVPRILSARKAILET